MPDYKGREYHADDRCIGQVCTELCFLYRENRMIAPLRQKFDFSLANPPDVPSLGFKQPDGRSQELWSWCDGLFMGPPTWLNLLE